MGWVKKGRIFIPDGQSALSKSHAQCPIVDYTEGDPYIRVYYSTRDEQSRSRPMYIDLDVDDPSKVIEISRIPILPLGELGEFDDCGVMPSWVSRNGDKKYLYYIGWNVRNTIPYHNSVGLAVSEDGGRSFKKFSNGPLWDRSYKEPHYSGTSCVLYDEGLWKNWYLSCTGWRKVNGISEPRYHIKYAESHDGIEWKRDGVIAIDYKDDFEAGIVKASVIRRDGIYQMWFSYRNFSNYRSDKSNSYRIGYAESVNGIDWDRKNVGDTPYALDVSEEGWDSIMVEYPHVFEWKGRLLMLYNGNGFGESGFGYAELQP